MRFEWQVEMSQKDYKALFGYKVFFIVLKQYYGFYKIPEYQ
jgi:hypothetical protein